MLSAFPISFPTPALASSSSTMVHQWRSRHPNLLIQLILLCALGHNFPAASAFSFPARHCERLPLPPLILPSSCNEKSPSSSHSNHSRRQDHESRPNYDLQLGNCLRRCQLSVMALVASTLILFPSASVATAQQTCSLSDCGGVWPTSILATANLSSITPSSIADLGLKPPTDQKPQIMFNGGAPNVQPPQQTTSLKTDGKKPILQGLVYFPERAPKVPSEVSPSGPQVKEQVDYYSDILVLTAVSAAYPEGPVLAGAKFPVSSVRFPFSFQMHRENLLTNRPGVQEAWESVATTGDVILRASVCPSDASSFPCNNAETKRSAEGLAKLITNLPGMEEGQIIRAPASLALQ